MKKVTPIPFLLVLAALLLLMSLPRTFSEKSRGTAAAFLAPLWESVNNFKLKAVNIFQSGENFRDGVAMNRVEETQRLQTENLALRRELNHLQEIIKHELYLTHSGVQRSSKWQQLLGLYSQAVPARIIFRNTSTWNSSCWINVGKQDNERLGRKIIAKDSPVVVGYSLVGVVDYVGPNQSRVRMLTDSGMTPSVRAVRGEPKQRMLAEQLNMFMDALMEQDRLFADSEQKMKLIERLEDLEKKLHEDPQSLYLAKGVLAGSSEPLWRTQGQLLKGTGFNCDFADNLSSARDLRTGRPAGDSKAPTESILKVKDLLITTGMDGVFPPGLHVAEVVRIFPLKEGDYYYELEAKPIAGSLDDLSLVYVMPPVGYDPDIQPPLMGWE